MAETESLTYRDLAERLGITVNSARIKARRRKWRVMPGNHPLDPARVEVPTDFLSRVAPPSVGDSGATPMSSGDTPAESPPVTGGATLVSPVTGDLVPLAKAWEMVAETVASERARADAQAARQLAERDSLHLGHVERLMAQAAAERSLWLERVDAAELRAERVEQRLDHVLDVLLSERRQLAPEPRRPWWRRWL